MRDLKVFKVQYKVQGVVGCLYEEISPLPKVLLAARKMIKVANFAFSWEMMEKHTHNQLFR